MSSILSVSTLNEVNLSYLNSADGKQRDAEPTNDRNKADAIQKAAPRSADASPLGSIVNTFA